MKKMVLTKIALATSILTLSSVFAHELFVSTESELAAGTQFNGIVTIDYYPAVSPLSADNLKVMKPLKLLGDKGEVKLTQQSDAKYSSDITLDKGSYLAVVSTNEYFYTKTPEGVFQDSKDKVEDALSCIKSAMFSKAIINVDGAVDTAVVIQPQGFALEIVPTGNLSSVKVGEAITGTLLRDGKPLVNQKIGAEFSVKDKIPEVEFVTDDKGQFSFTPTEAGDWILLSDIKEDYKNQAECDTLTYETSITFNVQP